MNTLKIMDIIKGNIVKIYNIQEKLINGFKIDSRKIIDNDVFIAIQGKNLDGNDYVTDAIKRGANLVITSKDMHIKEDIMVIVVDDTIEVLGVLAKAILKEVKVPVVAVTGSNGKTTTKELIANLLSLKYKVLKSDGNFNNHIGLPMTILNYKDEDVIVLEMGMNHKGEINKLTKICNPNIGVITNIGTAHIGNLGSKKNIYKAKLEIINGMKNGFLIINNDDKYLRKTKTNNNQIMRCGTNEKDNLKVIDIKYFLTKTNFKIKYMNQIYDFSINIPGKYIVYDVLLAIQVALILDIDISDMNNIINRYKTCNNRINVIDNNNYKIINDCYNSSYESLDNILSVIELIEYEKILIIGDIFELGKYNKKILKKLKKKINKISNKKVLLMGNNIKKIRKQIKNSIFCDNFDRLYSIIDEIDLNNKIILIKASHAMNFDKICNYLINVDKDK